MRYLISVKDFLEETKKALESQTYPKDVVFVTGYSTASYKKYAHPMVCAVVLREMKLSSAALSDYAGHLRDKAGGIVMGMGKKCDIALDLSLYGSADRTGDNVYEVMTSLTDTLSFGGIFDADEIIFSPISFDRELSAFCGTVTVKLSVIAVSRADADADEFNSVVIRS